MKVLVTDKINDIACKIIEDAAEVVVMPTQSEDDLIKIIGEYDALMVRSQTKVTAKIIEAAKNMKIIGRAGVGVDNIDVNAATQKGIIVVNSPDGNTTAAAEHTLALMMSMMRNIPAACKSTREGKWERSKFTGTEVLGKTLGVIGFGKIGSYVAKIALAMGMKVFVYDPFATEEYVKSMGAEYVKDLNNFWNLFDVLTVHVPKTPETLNLVNAETIAKMKDGVKLINCARGGIINEKDLKDALESGKVSSCAIDVYVDEPEITKCPLLGVEKNIVLTPHLGASTSEAQINVAVDVANQIRDVLKGGSALHAVNIPSLKPEKLEPVKDYMELASQVGSIAQQISTDNMKALEISFKGNLADLDTAPLETAILKGIFGSYLQDVNFVNAPIIAKNRGINVTTSKSSKSGDYTGTITVKMITDSGDTVVSGALIAKDIRRIVKINDYNTSVEPEKHLLLVQHDNKPSMVAQVANVIGGDNINIESMLVSPSAKNKNLSIMIIGTDKNVKPESLEKITSIDGVQEAKFVHL